MEGKKVLLLILGIILVIVGMMTASGNMPRGCSCYIPVQIEASVSMQGK